MTYFFLAVLSVRAAMSSSASYAAYLENKPLFYWDKSSILPMPMLNLHIHFGYWLMMILAICCFGLAMFFLCGVFGKKRIGNVAVKVGKRLSLPFALLVLFNFVISWLGGLTALLGSGPIMVAVFFYGGLILFVGLVVDAVLGLWKGLRKQNIGQFSSK